MSTQSGGHRTRRTSLRILFLMLWAAFLSPAVSWSTILDATPDTLNCSGTYIEAASTNNVVMHIPIQTDVSGDVLQQVHVFNNMDAYAEQPADIVPGSIKLWYVPDTNPFNPGTAVLIGAMTYNAMFRRYEITGLTRPVVNNSALYVTVDITANPTPYASCAFQADASEIVFQGGYMPGSTSPTFDNGPQIFIVPYTAAQQCEVSHTTSSQLSYSTGQKFSPFTFTLSNPGTPLTAPIWLTGLTLTVRDSNGALLPVNRALSQLGARDGSTDALIADLPVSGVSSSSVYLPLNVSVTALSALPLEITATMTSDTVNAVSSFRLEWTQALDLDAQDGYTFHAIPALPSGDAFPMQSNLLALQKNATQVLVYHTPGGNPVVIKGQSNVVPMSFTFVNPGNTGTARLDITRLTLAVTSSSGDTLAPAAVFTRLAIGGGILYGEAATLPASGSLVTIPLSKSFISVPVYEPVTVTVLADIREDALAIDFRLSLTNAVAVSAQDSNSLKIIPVSAAYASDAFPMFSPVFKIESTFSVTGHSLCSATLYSGQTARMLNLTFTHPGPASAGPLLLRGLTLTAQEQAGAPADISASLESLRFLDASNNVFLTMPPVTGSKLYIPFPNTSVAPNSSLALTLEIRLRENPQGQTLRIALLSSADVDAWQPADPGRPVYISGAWPIQSASAVIGGGEGGLRVSNYPNPFAAGRETTSLAYFLEQPSNVTIALYTLAGDQVASLKKGELQMPGEQIVLWDGRTATGSLVVNGVYLARIQAIPAGAGEVLTQLRKIAVVK